MQKKSVWQLAEIAKRIEADLSSDESASVVINGLNTLKAAQSSELAFVANARYLPDLQTTKAGAVILREAHKALSPVPTLVCADPYVAFAKISALFTEECFEREAYIHPTAILAKDVQIGKQVQIGPYCVVEEGVILADHSILGAGVFVGRHTSIGAESQLYPNVTLYHGVKVGKRAIIHSGAVIGADGFGFAPSREGWIKIHQLGGVTIGDDVEIGANTTIDRGAIEDTVIEDGVKIDDLVMIAHNVHIGSHSVLAGQVGIAGSARIGKRCILGGNVGLVGHIELCDDVVVTGKSMITKSISTPGSYSSGTPFQASAEWKKSAARFGQLDSIYQRLRKIQKDHRE